MILYSFLVGALAVLNMTAVSGSRTLRCVEVRSENRTYHCLPSRHCRLGTTGQCYDIYNEMECEGKVVRNSPDRACCPWGARGKLYNPSDHLCCAGNLYPRVSHGGGNNHECCGDQIIMKDTQLCCGDTPRNKTIKLQEVDGTYLVVTDHQEMCCGTEIYNFSSEICCTNDTDPENFAIKRRVFQTTDNADGVAKEIPHTCCTNDDGSMGVRFHTRSEDAENQQYLRNECPSPGDKREEISKSCSPGENGEMSDDRFCCNGNVINNSKQACCGGFVYSRIGQICCFNNIYNITDSTQRPVCCKESKKGYIDQNKEICCNGQSHDLLHGANTGCCGQRIINTQSEECCVKKIEHDGKNVVTFTSFDSKDHFCCGGDILPSWEKDKCCSNKWVSNADEVCCPSIGPVKRQNHEDNLCCEGPFSSYSTFNSKQQRCNHVTGDIHDKHCTGEISNSYICCNNEKYYNGHGAYGGCCGSKPMYTDQNAICCNETIFHVSGENFRCDEKSLRLIRRGRNCPSHKKLCAGKCYDPRLRICCSNKLHGRWRGDKCCDSKNYFEWNAECEDGQVSYKLQSRCMEDMVKHLTKVSRKVTKGKSKQIVVSIKSKKFRGSRPGGLLVTSSKEGKISIKGASKARKYTQVKYHPRCKFGLRHGFYTARVASKLQFAKLSSNNPASNVTKFSVILDGETTLNFKRIHRSKLNSNATTYHSRCKGKRRKKFKRCID